MLNIINSDIYRIKKSKLFYGAVILAGLISFLLVTLNRQDIRLGVSVFGNLTTFVTAKDVIALGIQYQKGIGLIVAILISVFIGQEYQWNTWQHKWLVSKSRAEMYLSKSILSAIVSTITFFIFENLALLFSGQIRALLANGYFTTLLCGSAIYMALGAVLCFISMLIKNSTISVIASLGYILFSETFITTLQNLGSISITVTKIVAWWVKHSIYGMSSILATASITLALICFIIINSFMIFTITTVVGMWVFRKYEL